MAQEFLGSSSESAVEMSVDSSCAASSASSSASKDQPTRSRRHPSGPHDADQMTDDDFRNIPRR